MAYEHDIFISYRRNDETLAWLENHFAPLLELRVGQELMRSPTIYIDVRKAEAGASWPPQLGIALGRSRILIALWAKDYFASEWCTEEMAQMLAREQESGLRSDTDPRGLVVIAVIHDGDDFPNGLAEIQRFDIKNSFNVRMAQNSLRAEELDATLVQQAPAIVHAINAAPEWRDAWSLKAAKKFRTLLQTAPPSQSQLPSLRIGGGG
jgi:TIR domain